MAGAVIIKTYHLISFSDKEFVSDVLQRSEFYLTIINRTFILLNSMLLFFVGIFTYKLSGNYIFSILIQLSPFTSAEIFYGLIVVSPENLLIFVSLLIICLLIYYLFKIDIEKKLPIFFIICFGITCALGVSAKLSFFPILLLPLILIKGIKNKIIFVFITFISFVVFIYPVLSDIRGFSDWIKRLVMNNGFYGRGDATIINVEYYFVCLQAIFTKDKFFSFSYFFLAFTLIVISRFSLNKIKPESLVFFQKGKIVLLGLFVSMSLQILIVAKHYSGYYMIPAFMLSVVSLAVSFLMITASVKVKLNLKVIYLCLIILIISLSSAIVVKSFYEAIEIKNNSENMNGFIDSQNPDTFIISTIGCARQECAFALATVYAGKQGERYKPLLPKSNSSMVIYDAWELKFIFLSSKSETIKSLKLKNVFIFQKGRNASLKIFISKFESEFGLRITEYKEIFNNSNDEIFYEMKFAPL